MRARTTTVHKKLASLLGYSGRLLSFCLWTAGNRWPRTLGWAWPMVQRPEWRKNAGLSLFLWPVNIAFLYFATKQFGHGLALMLGQNAVFDTATFGYNKWDVFKKRGTSPSASGGKSAFLATACFLYHKVLAILLMTVLGMGAVEVKVALGGVGIAENPVLFRVRDQWVFTEAGRHESSSASNRLESARSTAIGNWFRMKIGM